MSARRIHKTMTSAAFVIASLAWGLSAQAVEVYTLDQHAAIQTPTWMENSIQVQVTPKGQKLLSEDLTQLLSNMGIVINENYFPEFKYVTQKPINIEKLAKEKPKEFAMLLQVRQFFQQYLKGIQFKDFKPALRMGLSGYYAHFDKLSMVVDQNLMQQLGKTNGAVFAIEISISELTGQADDIHVKDLENPWLGEVGVKNPYLSLGSQKTPLKARMPFFVQVDPQSGLRFEALTIKENLDEVPIEVRYEKLLLPEFEFKVAGQNETYKVSLDDKEFKKLIDKNLPEGLKVVRGYVRDFLQNEFPKMLNEKSQEALKVKLEQIQNLPAAGTKPEDQRPPLAFGMRLSDMNLKDSILQLKLDAFIEDTTFGKSTAIWKNSGSRGTPQFKFDTALYDVGVAVDRVIMNRMVHLSHNRKNFQAMETCPGNPTVELMQPPGIDYLKTTQTVGPLETPLVVFIDARVKAPDEKTGGLFDAVNEYIRLKFKYKAILKPTKPGSTVLGIYSSGVDLNSLVVDDSSLTWIGKLAKPIVVKEIGKLLSQQSNCGNNSALAEFELINSLWGIPVEFAKIQMDPQGQMMMYLNYKKSSQNQEGL